MLDWEQAFSHSLDLCWRNWAGLPGVAAVLPQGKEKNLSWQRSEQTRTAMRCPGNGAWIPKQVPGPSLTSHPATSPTCPLPVLPHNPQILVLVEIGLCNSPACGAHVATGWPEQHCSPASPPHRVLQMCFMTSLQHSGLTQ